MKACCSVAVLLLLVFAIPAGGQNANPSTAANPSINTNVGGTIAITGDTKATAPASGRVTVSTSVGGTIGAVISGTTLIGSGVKNRPFSADVIEENNQFLPDGNRIHHETHGKFFRDSEGRLRQEMEFGVGMNGSTPYLHVSIQDPVQNMYISLDPQKKTATVHHYEPVQSPAKTQGTPTAQAGLSTGTFYSGRAGAQVARGNAGQGVNRDSIRQPEPVGSMDIEGYNAVGARRTITTPAGAMGNDKPITSTSETWYSPDLQVLLLLKSESPMGSHEHKLVNIQPGDPDPLLFQIPADYTVQETPQR